jgi:ribosomal protein S18 acetylase RimI-like enzyme
MIGYEGHRGWINYLAVDPARQREGFGREMMEEAERLLHAEGWIREQLSGRA